MLLNPLVKYDKTKKYCCHKTVDFDIHRDNKFQLNYLKSDISLQNVNIWNLSHDAYM